MVNPANNPTVNNHNVPVNRAGQGKTEAYLEPAGTAQPASYNGHSGNHELGQQTTLVNGGSPLGRQLSVTLTPEQFEQLYLQPGGIGGKGDLSKRFGNPTPLGVAGFLLCLTPFSIYVMGFGNSSAASVTGQIGPYYFLGGLCLVIAGIMEWIIGNTFPFLVFVSFGGFWLSFGNLNDPLHAIAASYSATGSAAEGGADPAYTAGIAVYLAIWGVLVFIYMLGSFRTNVAFVLLFFTLDIAFFLLSAAYFRISDGGDPTTLLTAGGAFAFVTTLCGWWIELALVLGSTGMPFSVPLGDLSGFLSKKKD